MHIVANIVYVNWCLAFSDINPKSARAQIRRRSIAESAQLRRYDGRTAIAESKAIMIIIMPLTALTTRETVALPSVHPIEEEGSSGVETFTAPCRDVLGLAEGTVSAKATEDINQLISNFDEMKDSMPAC